MKHWSLLVLLVIFIIALGWIWFRSLDSSYATNTEIRAAIDIGSGATNLKIAKVDRNTDKIIAQLFEQSIRVSYQQHLERSPNMTFDQEVMQEGIQAISTLKKVADSHQAKKVVAVATAAFRSAKNAPEFAKEIERQTGVHIRIIDQDEEGILAFRGALAITAIEADQAITWDIGGGSMQLTTLTESGTYLVEKGKTASVPFKNAIIQQIKHLDPQIVSSPNPLNFKQMQESIRMAEALAQQVDPFIKNKITHPSTQVLAVGNVFKYGILPLVNKQTQVQRNQLEQVVMKLEGKTDRELSDRAADVSVSNPLLVLGYMQGLKIQEIQIVDVNNADGALTYPAYWE
jgi:exopolyphosphatase/guanosine-5'-triphosphate,3'-diphosphate pyrophosphatase